MIACQRHLFDIPEDIAYLNCAYLSPLSHAVVAAGHAGMDRKTRPWEIVTRDFWEGANTARGLFGGLIGAEADDIAVVPAASYGMATAAANAPVAAGQRIIILAEQFPSNVAPWRVLAAERGAELVVIDRPPDDNWTSPLLAAIDDRAAVVAVPNCHWTDGTLVDLVAVGQACRDAGAMLAIDLTQSIGAMPFDVAEVRPDFLVAAGYKWMMAPYSIGFLYVDPKHREGRSLEHGWTVRSMDAEFKPMTGYELPFELAARRFDVGEVANFALMPAAIAALEQLQAWGPAEVQATLRAYTDGLSTRIQDLGWQVAPNERRVGHFLGLRRPSGLPEGIVERLAEENVYLTRRGTSLRVTPHLYNHQGDADRLVEALAREEK